jgi:hypothetical protein
MERNPLLFLAIGFFCVLIVALCPTCIAWKYGSPLGDEKLVAVPKVSE